MRRVNGYVCVARTDFGPSFPVEEILFGKGIRNGGSYYENLTSNGLVPYNTLGGASEGMKELSERREFSKISLARLRMKIADDAGEFMGLRRSKSVVVIKLEREGESWDSKVVGWSLLGPLVEGKPTLRPIPGARLTQNGFVTFDSLDKALELGREINRQGDSAIWLADFRMKFVRRKR